MANLKSRYMGLELKSPVIVGANNLVTDTDKLKRMEEAGAGAVVYKSLFEEQVQIENLELHERKAEYEERNAEMLTLYPDLNHKSEGIGNYLHDLRGAKESVNIPVFASLNALNTESWIEYALKVEETGVDGIELNFYTSPEKGVNGYDNIEILQLGVFKKIRAAVKLPISVKLSPYYSNPLRFIDELDKAGANGFVLFNRLFQPDIDIYSESHNFPYSLSNREDNRLPLRFSGLLYGNTKGSICANSGIIDGADVIKMILAGADCVQVVSTLYLNQIEVIGKMLKELEKWMNTKGYATIEDFRGKLSDKNSDSKLPYRRAQYMDFMMTTSEILKKYRAIN